MIPTIFDPLMPRFDKMMPAPSPTERRNPNDITIWASDVAIFLGFYQVTIYQRQWWAIQQFMIVALNWYEKRA